MVTKWHHCTQTSFYTNPFATIVFLVAAFFWTTRDVPNMKKALPTCKDDICPPGAENTGGSQRAPSCPSPNLGAIRIPRDQSVSALGGTKF